MDNEQIVNSIKSLCKSHNITITRLEEAIGLSQGLISRWSKSDPSLSKIIDIADYFDTSIDEVVGRQTVILDKFIEKLIVQTDNGNIIWKDDSRHLGIDITDDAGGILDFKSCYTIINSTMIYITADLVNYDIKNPKKLSLSIKPIDSKKKIEQDYSKEQLISLWLKVLLSLGDEAPDEIKVEEFKNSFIFEDKKENKAIPTQKNFEISNFIYNPAIIDVLESLDIAEFKKLKETFVDPEFKTAIKALSSIQDYFSQKDDTTCNQKED